MLKKFDIFGKIKTRKPSHRILITDYRFHEHFFLILLIGFPKKTEKADKKAREEYNKADRLRKLIFEDKNELHQKLDRILKRI